MSTNGGLIYNTSNNPPSSLSSSIQLTGLEQDNECLRVKLRQLREENAHLITSNHTLVGDLESVRYELHRTSGRLQTVEQEVTTSRVAAENELTSLRELLEQQRAVAQQELEQWQRKVEESSNTVQRSEELVRGMRAELDEQARTRKRIESERDLALDSAEKIQKAYEDFQHHVQERMESNQQRLDCASRDRQILEVKLNTCSTEMMELRESVHQLTRDCSEARDEREQLEQLNTELRAQLSRANIRNEKLETELNNCEGVKRENGELKTTIEQQRLRLERYQEEIGESRAQLGQLEDLAQRLQQSMVAGRNHTQQRSLSTDACQTSFVSSRNSSIISDTVSRENLSTAVAELKAKLLQQDVDFRSIKSELERKTIELERTYRALEQMQTCPVLDSARSSASLSGENDRSKRRVCELETSLAHYEDERERLLITIANLERRLADVEASKAASDAELVQRGAQLENARRETTEQVAREASISRELRKRALQMASLEHQLDEKVAEISALITRIAGLESELRRSNTELRQVRNECDEQSRVAAENAAACTEMRKLHDSQCRELENAASGLSDQRRELELAFAQSDSQVATLRSSLQEMTAQVASLKQELARREMDAERNSAALENNLRHSVELSEQLEKELVLCRAELDAKVDRLLSYESQVASLNGQLQDNVKLDAQLTSLNKMLQERDQLITELKLSLEKEQEQLKRNETKQSEQEYELVRLLTQIGHLEQSLQRNTVDFTSDLESTEKKLQHACAELANKDEEIHRLTGAIHNVQLERSRVLEDLGGQLKTSRKELKRERKEREELANELKQLKAEVDLSAAACEEKDERVKNLLERLSKLEAEVETSVAQRTELLSNLERLRSSASEDLSRVRAEKDSELECCRHQIESVQAALNRCEEALRSRDIEIENLASALQERQWELQQRAAQLTQLDMGMKDRSSDWDQRLSRLEAALRNSRFETEQRSQQVKQLEEQVGCLMKALKDKSSLLVQSEQICRKQEADIQILAHKASEVENLLTKARQDHELASAVNREAQEQLGVSRRHLEALQAELSETRGQLSSTCNEHDRLARDLAEAVALLQSKEAEYAKLLQQLTDAGDERMRSQRETELDNQAIVQQHVAETNELRRRATAARDEAAQLQRQLLEAGDRQTTLVAELRRMAQQLSSTQMELDASRAIAGAQRETVLVRDAEIARLEARLSLLQRTVQHPVQHPMMQFAQTVGRYDGRSGRLTPGANIDLSSISAIHPVESANSTSFLMMPTSLGSSEQQKLERVAAAAGSGDDRLQTSQQGQPRSNGNFIIDEEESENPDSLEAMWRQLQLADDGSAGVIDRNNISFNNSNRTSDLTSTGISDPRRAAAVLVQASDTGTCRSTNAFEEKARIQSRIKALIGYREPAKKQKSKVVGKPLAVSAGPTDNGSRNRVNRGPQNHSRAGSVTDSGNTSLVSTAVAHYSNTDVR